MRQQIEAKGLENERLKVMVLQAVTYHVHGEKDKAEVTGVNKVIFQILFNGTSCIWFVVMHFQQRLHALRAVFRKPVTVYCHSY